MFARFDHDVVGDDRAVKMRIDADADVVPHDRILDRCPARNDAVFARADAGAVHHREADIEIPRNRRKLESVGVGDMNRDALAVFERRIVKRRHDVRVNSARDVFEDFRL